MPVLNWIGKDAVMRHDAEVPFRLLHDVPELAGGGADSGNLIVARPVARCPPLCSAADADEKKRIGELWERRSGGRFAFAWVESEDRASLQNAALRCAALRDSV